MSKKRVYVVRFDSQISDESFIKVGVSSNDIKERFARDLNNYKVTLLRETEYYDEGDSLIVESNFHSILQYFKYEPILRLKSGNTECFINTNDCIKSINKILDTKFSNNKSGYDMKALIKIARERKKEQKILKERLKKKPPKQKSKWKSFKEEATLARRLKLEKYKRNESPMLSGKRYSKF